MLILNNGLPSKYFFAGGESPSGDSTPEQKAEKTKTPDLSNDTEVIKKTDRIDVAEQAKRTMEIAAYKAAYTKLEELAKQYAQELNQNMKMDEAIQVRALADKIGNAIQYQCDERSFDSADSSSGKRWVDIHLVEQYKELSELISKSPLASKDNLMAQIVRIKIPTVRGTTTAQEIMAYRVQRYKKDQSQEASTFGMIGVVEGVAGTDNGTKQREQTMAAATASSDKKKDNTAS